MTTLTKYIPKGTLWLCPMFLIGSDLLMNLYGKDAGSRNAVKPRRGVKKLARPSSTAQDKRSVLHQIGEFMK